MQKILIIKFKILSLHHNNIKTISYGTNQQQGSGIQRPHPQRIHDACIDLAADPRSMSFAVLCFPQPGATAISVVAFVGMIILSCGLFVQQPNQSRVLIFFGKYKGTFRGTGFFWVNPFMSSKKISLRIRNMDIAPIKVNDKVGNPVMIGMVLVWKVRDTYRAVFDVDSDDQASSITSDGKISLGNSSGAVAKALDAFVAIQSDAALREVTGRYAYDEEDGASDSITLRSSGHEINEQLEEKLNERLAMAGIEVVEARLNYLAYAPEIAAVMLRRQQASAIISAREKLWKAQCRW